MLIEAVVSFGFSTTATPEAGLALPLLADVCFGKGILMPCGYQSFALTGETLLVDCGIYCYPKVFENEFSTMIGYYKISLIFIC